MNTQLDDIIRTTLDAQANAVDVSVERPALTPESARDARILPFRSLKAPGTFVAVLTAAAVIVGIVVVRGSAPTRRAVVVSGSGRKVVLAGTRLDQYDFAHVPDGFHAVSSPTDKVDAACIDWTVDADTITCHRAVGGFGRVYKNASGASLVISAARGFPAAVYQPYQHGEHVTVQGRAGWFNADYLKDELNFDVPADREQGAFESVAWTTGAGDMLVVAYNAPTKNDAPTRDELLDLANHVRSSVVNATIGLRIGDLAPEGAGAAFPIAVSGTNAHPCAGIQSECVPLSALANGEASFTNNSSIKTLGLVIGMTDQRVASVRLTGGGPALTTNTVALPGYTNRFFVINVAAGVHPERYQLLDASGGVIEEHAFDASLLETSQPTQEPTTPTGPSHPVPGLEFREVRGTSPYAPGCAAPDRARTVCYALGSSLIPKVEIVSAQALIDPSTSAWIVNVNMGNEDFVTKVAIPDVGRQIAIVYNGEVESAPTINAGIVGRTFQISANFTKAEAQALAKALNGQYSAFLRPHERYTSSDAARMPGPPATATAPLHSALERAARPPTPSNRGRTAAQRPRPTTGA